jgi:hypothetical protein
MESAKFPRHNILKPFENTCHFEPLLARPALALSPEWPGKIESGVAPV